MVSVLFCPNLKLLGLIQAVIVNFPSLGVGLGVGVCVDLLSLYFNKLANVYKLLE